MLTKISLFSGIGGDDLASEWAGIKTICFVENDKFCQKVLRKHYPDTPIIGDIHDVTAEKIREIIANSAGADGRSSSRDTLHEGRSASQDRRKGLQEDAIRQDGSPVTDNQPADTDGCAEGSRAYPAIDIVAGGDPCQPRSIAGQRRGRADDRDLWPEMFRVIREFKPTWVVNENPTGRLTMDFYEVLSDLEGAGYETRSFVIPACGVNAPHRRDRLFIVAYNDGKRKQQFHTESGLSNINATNSELSGSEQGYGDSRESFSISRGSSFAPADSQAEGSQGFIASTWEQGQEIRNKSTRRCYRAWGENWLEVATAFCGMDDGLPHRVARLKALGNSVVPQQIYPIYQAISELKEAYENWCKDNGQDPVTRNTFKNRLTEKGIADHKGTGGQRFWTGIRLKNDTDDSGKSGKTPGENEAKVAKQTELAIKPPHEEEKLNTLRQVAKLLPLEPDNPDQLPNCPKCGRNEWQAGKENYICPCGNTIPMGD